MLNNNQTTPIHRMHESINSNTFYIKREDLLPVSFGGNKARKAILFFNEMIKSKSDCVVTYGTSSSNHCVIIANMAAAKGIPCYIISPSESNNSTYNSKLTDIFGAIITYCPVKEVKQMINRKLEELNANGYKPYFIQGGGHGDLGTEAYIGVYNEILEYEYTSGTSFDYIFHTSGTGTTQAGLICGKLLQGHQREVIGISNARKNPYGSQVVLDSVNSYFKKVEKESVDFEMVTFVDDYILNGYGDYKYEILETIKDILITDGIPMDTTYTGKSFWGMKKYIEKNQIFNKNILFIHTGGTPLFFDNLEEISNE